MLNEYEIHHKKVGVYVSVDKLPGGRRGIYVVVYTKKHGTRKALPIRFVLGDTKQNFCAALIYSYSNKWSKL